MGIYYTYIVFRIFFLAFFIIFTFLMSYTYIIKWNECLLDKAALSFVNEYWQGLYKSMLPTVEKHWDYHLTDFVNRLIFSKISFSKTFP